MKQKILFLRNASLYSSADLAIEALSGLTHSIGQPVIALYGTEDNVKVKLAIGIKNGTGSDTYQLIANDADLSDLVDIVSSLNTNLTNHKAELAGSTAGHAKSGGDLTFASGAGTVNANAITSSKIANSNVTYAKLQKVVAANTVLGSKTANGTVSEISMADLRTMLNVANGAEVNQNAFSNVKVGSTTIAATSKTDTVEIASGSSNVTVEADKATKKVTISVDASQADHVANPLTISLNGVAQTPFDGSTEVAFNINPSSVGAATSAQGAKADTAVQSVKIGTGIELKSGTSVTLPTSYPASDKLTTSRTIAISGDVSGTATSFDGSANITIPATISNLAISKVSGLQAALNAKAPLASPALTGTPTAPTAATGTKTTQIATTAFVDAAINSGIAGLSGALVFKGTVDAADDLPNTHTTGWTYVVSTAGTYVGQVCEIGDMIICVSDGTTAKNSDWNVVQTNINGAVTGPASSTDSYLAVFNGSTGKVIKQGIAQSAIVQTSRTVTAGTGLTGGGALSSNITLTHQVKPTAGTDAGGTGGFVTGVNIDSLGHISGTTKGNLTGGTAATAGKYISAINVSGVSVTGTLADLPTLSGGAAATAGQYVSGVTVSGHTVTVTKAALPSESGKVKVSSSDTTADYLGAKLSAATATGNTYSVTPTASGNKVELSCTIDVIDGGEC
jgi:hypothetical protein